MFTVIGILSLVLSLASWWGLLGARPPQVSRVASAALLMTNWCFLIIFHICDRLSGDGINEAVVYHLRASLQGTGFADFSFEIALSCVLVGIALALAAFVVFPRDWPHLSSRLRLRYSSLLIAVALLLNPAFGSLAQIWERKHHSSSDFYRYYIPSYIRDGEAPNRNLVYVYAESFERTYFDTSLFPGLTTQLGALEKEAISFSNIQSPAGTTWTIAGIVGSMSGIPLLAHSQGNSLSGVDKFLPGASGLGNLLKRKGYRLEFCGGANTRFAGKDRYLKTQEFDVIDGLHELVQSNPRLASSVTSWGLYDEDLLELAYQRFEKLSREAQPFGLFILTLDTHHPAGHLSPSYVSYKYQDGSNPMLNAIKGSDALLACFIQRLRHSPYAKKTTIILASDHIVLPNKAYSILERGKRRNTFMIFNPESQGAVCEKPGSTLDIGSTILPFLGHTGQIGLGRNLLAATTTDQELSHIQKSVNAYAWSEEILSLWRFPTLQKGLSISASDLCLRIQNRQFQLPCLVVTNAKLESLVELQARPDAQFSSYLPDAQLAQRVRDIAPGRAYILVMQGSGLGLLQSGLAANSWYVVTGKAGGDFRIRLLDRDIYIGRAELEKILSNTLGDN